MVPPSSISRFLRYRMKKAYIAVPIMMRRISQNNGFTAVHIKSVRSGAFGGIL